VVKRKAANNVVHDVHCKGLEKKAYKCLEDHER